MTCLSFEKLNIYMPCLKLFYLINRKQCICVDSILKPVASIYGIRCTEKCGHCSDGNLCDHINGTCATGCSAGYQGDLCKSRE